MQKTGQTDEESFKLRTAHLTVKYSKGQKFWKAEMQDDENKRDLRNYKTGQKEIHLMHMQPGKQVLEVEVCMC